MKQIITDQASYEQTDDYIHVEFNTPHRVISSAVLNGGLVEASHILNLKVPKHSETPEAPITTLTKYCTNEGWKGTAVGMMTAASMGSFRLAKRCEEGIEVVVIVTSGLSNPRRTGDRAEYRKMISQVKEQGTINIIAMTSARLTDAAMVEALLIVTEAKAAALQDAEILSPVSNQIATGTGTDSVAVVGGQGPETVSYCGKHVLFGEILGQLVCETVSASIEWYQTNMI